MITAYIIDPLGFYTGNSVQYGIYDVLPMSAITGAEPVTEVNKETRWTGSGWELLTHEEADEVRAAALGTQPAFTVSLSASTLRTAVNTNIDVTVTASVPLNDSFAVPVLDEFGKTVLLRLVTFSNSATTSVSISFPKSGYYRITEAALNSKLPFYVKLLTEIEFVIYE